MADVSIDQTKLKATLDSLKANPPTEAEIAADPKAFLAKHGVIIDDQLSNTIKSRFAAKAAGTLQASIVHIDT